MRAKTGSKHIIAFSLVVLLAIFIFTLALSVDLASADSAVTYIAAEVTTASGDFVPSGMVYNGSPVNLSFVLYTSGDRTSWTKDDAFLSKFELRYYNAATSAALLSAPTDVGSYYVDVVAKDSSLYEYFSSDMNSIVQDTIIGTASFAIYNQNLYLYNSALDGGASNGGSVSGVSNLLLPDSGADYYTQVLDGTALYLGGIAVDSSNYVTEVQYKGAGGFSATSAINKVGTYRLKLTIGPAVDLSATVADASLEKSGGNYYFYREFTVTCETLSFTLSDFSLYEGGTRDVTLSAASASKLTSLAGTNYQTQLLYYPTQDGIARAIAADGSNSDLYHPTEAGVYIYRVVFTGDIATYGVKAGDYVDVSFEILPVPYVVRYFLDDDTEVDYRLNYSGSDPLNINPIFYDLNGNEIGDVYTDVGAKKYSVTYKFYNGAEWINNAPIAAGRYKAFVHFNQSASVGTYPIPEDIVKEFQIVSGTLTVETTSPSYYLPTTAVTLPEFSFTSASGDESANIGAYTVAYYQKDGALIGSTAPTGVGDYIYELTVQNAIDRLGVPAGAKYRGYYSILYRPIEVSLTDGVKFFDGITGAVLLDRADGVDPDFQISYFVKAGNICKLLAAEPTEEGQYVMQIVVKKALANYQVAVGDVYSYSFTRTATSAMINISTTSLDLTYDGGVKVPSVSFMHDSAVLALTPLADYQTAYYRLDGSTYVPCGEPVLAGTYRYVVTFLKSDQTNGLTSGAYMRSQFVLAPAQYAVTFTVSDASNDLVYDAQEKTYDVSFTYKSRPVELDSTVKYAVYGDAFGNDAFINVGSYSAKVILDDDKSGSLALVGSTIDFSIVKLSLKATFVVPLGYNRMWTGSFVNPEVEYLCLNGRYKDQNWQSSFGIDLNESVEYSYSADGVHYTEGYDPILPGEYKQQISLGNANVELTSAVSKGDNDEVVSSPSFSGSVASQNFKITPREVLVKYTYDAAKDSLYYTGDTNGDRKGVSQVAFMAYQDVSTGYANDVSALFEGDYTIYYYTSDYLGSTAQGTQSTVKPYDKGYYVARVMLSPDGNNDDYLNKYTFKDGKDLDGALGESALSENCYVDDIFRIRDQNKLKIIYEMPDTFAENNEFKTISVKFENNFSEVGLEEGIGKDYRISYLDEENNENYTSFKTAGKYRVKITFLKDNVAYRLEDYSGTYTKGNDYYIANGDTLVYGFEVFEQRLMQVDFTAPASLYYDATEKAYQARFFVSDDWTDCAVTLTYDTHYRLRYYKKEGTAFTLMQSGVPTAPGDYAVEVVFLKDLLDYKYGGKTILKDNFYSVSETASGEKVATPRLEFTIGKAVLTIGGVKAKDKSFDGTLTATFDESKRTLSIKQIDGVNCGANIHNVKASDLSGSLAGKFDTAFPGEGIAVALDESGKYALPAEYQAYYALEYPVFSATITKATITVLLRDGQSAHQGTTILVTREYNPYSIESEIAFRLSYDENLIDTLFPSLDKSALTVGALSYDKGAYGGNSVGDYPIVLNTLALNDAATGAVYSAHPISDLFALALEKDCYYSIVARPITISVQAAQCKTYGDADPDNFIVSVTSGRLIYGDSISYTATRASGENAGRYLISLTNVKVVDKQGEDVSANYDITKKTEYFQINRRELKISPRDQTATYLMGFSHTDNADVLDMTLKNNNGVYGVNVTSRYLTDPPVGGDRLSGKLSYAIAPEEGTLKFRILQGTMTTVVNALGKNVTSNYVITFDETPKYYTITRVDVVVKLKEDVKLQKYYGDKEPVIEFTMDKSEKDKLGSLTFTSTSSIGRVQGEEVGSYRLYADNSAHSFCLYDDGIDVSDYFTFSVRQKIDGAWRVLSGETEFAILPRPVIVTVEDASYQNTGREVTPVLKYLNANGSRLSATLREDLESRVNIQVPKIEYHDGENAVTPEIVGATDPNYEITLQAGTITIVYLQNILTVTPLEQSDEVYKGRKFMLSGIMLYKTLRFYKIETANGEQPTHELDITLPVDKDLAGDGLVVVALRQDGSTKAFSFAQDGLTVVYSDDGAYYVAISEVQEWFYVIWGVVIVIALVGVYFLVRLIMSLVKKHKPVPSAAEMQKLKEKKDKKPREAKRASGVKGVKPTGKKPEAKPAPATDESDSMFSDTAVTESAPKQAPAAQPIAAEENTDDLFTDVAPVESEQPAPAPKEDALAGLDLDAETLAAIEALDIAPTEEKAEEPAPMPEKESKKDKKEKEKKDKKGKKDKDDANKPKGFVPTAFKPKGDRTSVYAPTRSFAEDLFNEDASKEDDGSSLLSDTSITDSSPIAPVKPASSGSDDDELVVSRSSGFSFDDAEETEKKNDDDLM